MEPPITCCEGGRKTILLNLHLWTWLVCHITKSLLSKKIEQETAKQRSNYYNAGQRKERVRENSIKLLMRGNTPPTG